MQILCDVQFNNFILEHTASTCDSEVHMMTLGISLTLAKCIFTKGRLCVQLPVISNWSNYLHKHCIIGLVVLNGEES